MVIAVASRKANQLVTVLLKKLEKLIGSVSEIPIPGFIPGFLTKSHKRVFLHGIIRPCTTSECPHMNIYDQNCVLVWTDGTVGVVNTFSPVVAYAGSSRGSQFPSPLRAYVNSSTPVRVGFDNRYIVPYQTGILRYKTQRWIIRVELVPKISEQIWAIIARELGFSSEA